MKILFKKRKDIMKIRHELTKIKSLYIYKDQKHI